jgi:hypothetical protein
MKIILLWIPEFNYLAHKRTQLVHTLTQSSSFPSIFLMSLENSLPLRFPTKLTYPFISPYAYYASRQSHSFCGFFHSLQTNTRRQLVQRLRMSGDKPPLLHMPLWYMQGKFTLNFTSNACLDSVFTSAATTSKLLLVSIYFHVFWDARNRLSSCSFVKSFNLKAFVKVGN